MGITTVASPEPSEAEAAAAGASPEHCGAEVAGAASAEAEKARAGGSEPLHHPETHEIELAAVLHALSDPMRLRIVQMLVEGEHNCKSIGLPVTKSTCTHHFRVLREAGVIRQRLEGTTRMNTLRRQELDARFPGLLDAVVGAVESMPAVMLAASAADLLDTSPPAA